MGADGRSVIPKVGAIVFNSAALVMPFKILSVVGARPNFMKVAAICEAIKWTDSVGVQEETTILGVPCITLRDRTERPVTIEHGTNVLAGSNPERIITEFNRLYRSGQKSNLSPRYWDGNAAKRIIKVLVDDFSPQRSLVAAG
jgi:UDP-N-acetylglucosamine 2-epimerase